MWVGKISLLRKVLVDDTRSCVDVEHNYVISFYRIMKRYKLNIKTCFRGICRTVSW